MKTYLLGTGLCMAAGIMIIVAAFKLTTVNVLWALWAIPVVLVGFVIQVIGLFQIRQRPPHWPM